MAKRKQRAAARKKTASKRGKASKAKSALRKAAKHTSAKARAKKLAKRSGAARTKKAAKHVAVKTRAKKQATKARATRGIQKTTPRPAEPPTKAPEAFEETVIVDIVEEPVPGVMVVTELESVQTGRPETPSERGQGSGHAEREKQKQS